MTQAPPPEAAKKAGSTIAWVSSTYFAEGLPYMVVMVLSGIYFTDIGLKERYIGYLNLLGLAWNFKFVWAPFVDSVGTKRRWMVVVQFLVSLMLAAIAATSATSAANADINAIALTTSMLLVGLAFIAATNDIVIDGFYLEAMKNKKDQAAYSGYRVMAYRLAVIFARSGLVYLAAVAGRELAPDNKPLAWAYAFGGASVAMFLLTIAHGLFLPRPEDPNAPKKDPKAVLQSYVEAFVTYLKQYQVVRVLAFIVLYKLGDQILFAMNSTFLMREIGLDKDQMSWMGGIIGAWSSIAGAMLGGWWIKKTGLKKAIWPLTLLMNLNIWAYCWLAYAKPDIHLTSGLSLVAAVHAYEQIAAGLGSAVLLVYLLRTCSPEHKAGHYAIGSAIMSLGTTVIGSQVGKAVEMIGYLNVFMLSFVATVPSMILLFFVPLKEEA